MSDVQEDVQSVETVLDEGVQEKLDATDHTEEPEELGAPSLSAAIEALLLLADEPMSIVALAQATRQTTDEVETAVRSLVVEYDQAVRGFELREIAGGWRYYTRDACSGVIERWVLDGQQARLTQAALETLAVVAYRQPVTRARISAVRGVNVDGVLKTLVARGLVLEAGSEHESGAHLYRTTSYFLERLGIASLDELPDLAMHLPDFSELEEMVESSRVDSPAEPVQS
jgi:segregation and condensation protein B